jgi:hypothetical protein
MYFGSSVWVGKRTAQVGTVSYNYGLPKQLPYAAACLQVAKQELNTVGVSRTGIQWTP